MAATFNFKPNKKGNSGVLTVTGTLSANGMTLPINDTFTLAKNKTITITDYLFGITGGAPVSTAGTFSVKKNKINYATAVTIAPQVTVNGTISVNPKPKKAKLAILFVVSSNGMPAYTFTFEATKKGK